MGAEEHRSRKNGRSFLSALIRDARANTLALMAMSLIPLAGMVGGGVDISRMYIVKTRLQHACDAGALAGRKAMGGGTWSYSNYYPRTSAEDFFDANYNSEAYGATNVTRTYTENAGKVTGTASATLPMTLMRIFGRTTETLTVNCDAEMRLPNTDVMFVLDTTGSMNDIPLGDTQTKMAALKVAVKCFYEIVARLDTDATCTTGTPSGGTGNQVQIRFGFMPYATNVNVGKLLPTDWFASTWQYQTREATYSTSSSNTWVETSSQTLGTTPASAVLPQSNCNDAFVASFNYSDAPVTIAGGTTRRQDFYTYDAQSWSGGTCYGTQTRTRRYYTYQTTSTQTFSGWRYARLPVNVGLLKNGTSWNNSFVWPIAAGGTNKTITWDGCIEERATVKQATYSPIPSGAKDLNIDLVPSTGDATTQWGPVLPDLIYTRNGATGWNLATSLTTLDYGNQSSYDCPEQAKKLQSWPTASVFDDYVDSLSPGGNTYHDIGLLWGARFASPTGIFASENDYTPQGGEIERHIIFMTDGDTCTNDGNYQAYGVAWFDRRQTDSSVVPTEGCTDTGTLTQQVNARTEALCTAIKNKNITLWVITFGSLSSTTNTRMTACATTGRYFNATNAATLQATFKSIADQISQLRLTR
ncbi:pilus assembly protein TadG-related protein [Sphingomonas sp.]|jgi:Flp pilus assembly protein TadG|uniref:pilus assembly protein TadG-related protein n=1 Tax=Sphingomonas sp. TaxID=28214 RepID=UPI002EDBAC9D